MSKSSKEENYQTDDEELEEIEEVEEMEEAEESDVPDDVEEEPEEKEDSDQDSENEEKDQDDQEEDETYNDEDLLEELYEEENDDVIEESEEIGNDPPDEAVDEGIGDEDNDFEEKRKRSTTKNRKDVKRRLFPFIQKDRRLARAGERTCPEYYGFNMRKTVPEFLENLGGLTNKGCGVMENAIYNATARYFQLNDRIVPEDDSIEFKKIYWNILRHVVGSWKQMSKKEILEEIKTDKWGLKSKLFIKAQETEKLLEQKIKQPDEVTEDSNYPCPKCRGIRHTRLRVQDRSGDEAGSLRLWCSNSSCGHGWRITG